MLLYSHDQEVNLCAITNTLSCVFRDWETKNPFIHVSDAFLENLLEMFFNLCYVFLFFHVFCW